MTQQVVELVVNQGVAMVYLARPDKHNAINMAMFYGLDKVINTIAQRTDIRVVIVAGQGPSFCSGLDVKSVLSDGKSAAKLLFKWLPGNANLAQRVSIGWRRLKVPVIMALHGKCWGGGMQIALGGDFRIAAADCSLSVMETKWGLIPDMGGTPSLLSCVGTDQALRLAMTAEVIDANSALELGLITQIANDPSRAALELAQQLVERSPDTNKTLKRMYYQLSGVSERKYLAKETINQIKVILGRNQRIAVKRANGDKTAQYR